MTLVRTSLCCFTGFFGGLDLMRKALAGTSHSFPGHRYTGRFRPLQYQTLDIGNPSTYRGWVSSCTLACPLIFDALVCLGPLDIGLSSQPPAGNMPSTRHILQVQRRLCFEATNVYCNGFTRRSVVAVAPRLYHSACSLSEVACSFLPLLLAPTDAACCSVGRHKGA